MPTRIAMWSGPRNISTALMRSWDARGDTFVCDEPLYAHYLAVTGLPHPGAEEVVEHHETDWRAVTRWLTGPVPEGRSIFYQKHMAHHLLDDIERAWIDGVTNCFLIRDPASMLASLAKVLPDPPSLADTGLSQQVRLFDEVADRSGVAPPVIDARDVLTDPAGVLAALCDAVGVSWTDRMLRWPAGPRPTDGVWARHWYDAVEQSTGFAPYRPRHPELPDALRGVLDACREPYERLSRHRLSSSHAPDV